MRTIYEIVWPDDRIEHIARHGISLEEVEDTVFGNSLVLKAKRSGPNPVYHVLGRTASGRMIFCVIISFPDGKGYPVTARPMTEKEKKKYRDWKGRRK
jgi:uncharacterized protein